MRKTHKKAQEEVHEVCDQENETVLNHDVGLGILFATILIATVMTTVGVAASWPQENELEIGNDSTAIWEKEKFDNERMTILEQVQDNTRRINELELELKAIYERRLKDGQQ